MDTLLAYGVTPVEAGLLLAFTLAAIITAQIHSFREALAAVRANRGSITWRATPAIFVRHEAGYFKRIPMLIAFVLSAVWIIAGV